MKIKDGSTGLIIWVGSLVLCATLFAQESSQNDPQASADQGNTTAPSRPFRVRVSQGVALR